MEVVRASSKGQIVLPKRIREKLGIKPGRRILIRLVEDRAEIIPLLDDPVEELGSFFKGHAGSLAESLLEERGRDRRIEEGDTL